MPPYGNHYSTDDGNIPSLLSQPYLGAVTAGDPTYQNTRRMLLSPDVLKTFNERPKLLD